MPRAPRFWGPRAYSLLFPPEFLFPVLSRGRISALVRDLKEPKPPENARPPKVCFVPCFSASARGPKEPKVPRKRQAPKFKNRGAMSGAPNGFLFPVSARGPKESKAPQKRSSKRKNREAPKFKKRAAPKVGPQTNFSVPSLGKGLQKARSKNHIGVRKFQNLQ